MRVRRPSRKGNKPNGELPQSPEPSRFYTPFVQLEGMAQALRLQAEAKRKQEEEEKKRKEAEALRRQKEAQPAEQELFLQAMSGVTKLAGPTRIPLARPEQPRP